MILLRKTLAVLLSFALLSEAVPAWAGLTTEPSFSRSPDTDYSSTFAEQALTSTVLSMPFALLRSDSRTRINRFYRPAVAAYRRFRSADRNWLDQSEKQARQELRLSGPASDAAIEARLQTLALTDAELLAADEVTIVHAHPILEDILTRLPDLIAARQTLAEALQQGDLPRSEIALAELHRLSENIETLCNPLALRTDPFSFWQTELDLARFGVEFLRTHPTDPFARLMTIPDIVERLTQSSLGANARTVLQIARIDLARWDESLWEDCREALRYARFAAEVPNFGDRVNYLLSRVEAGAISGLTAKEWSRHVPTFGSDDWKDLVDLLRLRPEESTRIPTLEEKINARFAPTTSRAPWIWKEALSSFAVLILAGVLTFPGVFNGITGPSAEDEAADNARPTVNEPYNAAFAEQLKAMPGLDPVPMASDPARQESIKKIQQEIGQIQGKLRAAEAQHREQEQKVQRAQEVAKETQHQFETVQKALSNNARQPPTTADAAEKALEFNKQTAAHQPGLRKAAQAEATPAAQNGSSNLGSGQSGLAAPAQFQIPGINGHTLGIPSSLPLGMQIPGTRQVLVRFQYPVSGYIRTTTYDSFNREKGAWEIMRTDLENMKRVPEQPGARTLNTATMAITGGLTPLPIPEDLTIKPETVSFSLTGATYDVLRDRHGQIWLSVPGVPAGTPAGTVSFQLCAGDSSVDITPTPEAYALMETGDWPSPDTRDAVKKAKDAPNDNLRIKEIERHVLNTAEYSLNPAFNAHHNAKPGHYLSGIDSFRPTIAGVTYRPVHCTAGNTYGAALLRSAGQPAGLVTGFFAANSTTVLKNPQLHAWIVVYTQDGPVRVDMTPPDRDREEEKYFKDEEMPASSPELARLREAETAATAAAENEEHQREEEQRLRDEAQNLLTQKQEAEARLWKQLHPPEPSQPTEAELAAGLTVELARIYESWKQHPPTALQVRKAVWNNVVRMTSHHVEESIQLRYLSALCEQAMPFLSRRDQKTLMSDYLPLLTRWFQHPYSGSARVFDERAMIYESRLLSPISKDPLADLGILPNEKPPKTTVQTWDVSTSFPRLLPEGTPASPSQVSVMNPSQADKTDAPRWVQDTEGRIVAFQTENQLYSMKGEPVLMPATDDIQDVQPGPDGTLFTLVNNMAGKNVLQNPLTGATREEIQGTPTQILSMNDGRVFALTLEGQWYKPFRVLPNGMVTHQPLFAKIGHVSLVSLKGIATAYRRYIPSLRDHSSIDIETGLDITPGWFRKAPDHGLITSIQIVENPDTDTRYIAISDGKNPSEIRNYDTGTLLSPGNLTYASRPVITKLGRAIYLGRREGMDFMDLYEVGQMLPFHMNVKGSKAPNYLTNVIGGTANVVITTVDTGEGHRGTRNFRLVMVSLPGQGNQAESFDLVGDPEGATLVNDQLILRVFTQRRWALVGINLDGYGPSGSLSGRMIRLSDPGVDAVSRPFKVGNSILFAQKLNGRWQWKSTSVPVTSNLEVLRVTRQFKTDIHIVFEAEVLGHKRRFVWDGKKTTDITDNPFITSLALSELTDIIRRQEQLPNALQSFTSPTGEEYSLPLGRNAIIRRRDNARVSAPDVRDIREFVFSPNGNGYYIARGDDRDRVLQLGAPHLEITFTKDPGTRVKNLSILRDGHITYVETHADGSTVFCRLTVSHAAELISPRGLADPRPTTTERSATMIVWKKTLSGEAQPRAFSSIDFDESLSRDPMAPSAELSHSPGLQTGPEGTAVIYLPASDQQHVLAVDPEQELDLKINELLKIHQEFPDVATQKVWRDAYSSLLLRVKQVHKSGSFIPVDRLIPLFFLTEGQPEHKDFSAALATLDKLPGHHEVTRKELAKLITSTFGTYRQIHGRLPFNPRGIRGAGLVSRILQHQLETFHVRFRQLRFTASPATDLLKFNDAVDALVSHHPWLALSVKDVETVWSSSPAMAMETVREVRHQPLVWFTLAELLAAIAGLWVGIQNKKIRKHFMRMLNAWVDAYGESVFEADLASTPSRLSVPKDREEREPFELFLRQYRNSAPEVQHAAWLILFTNHLIPAHRSWKKVFRQTAMILPMIREAVQITSLARRWAALASLSRPVVQDRVSIQAFIKALNDLKTKFRIRLNTRHTRPFVATAA